MYCSRRERRHGVTSGRRRRLRAPPCRGTLGRHRLELAAPYPQHVGRADSDRPKLRRADAPLRPHGGQGELREEALRVLHRAYVSPRKSGRQLPVCLKVHGQVVWLDDLFEDGGGGRFGDGFRGAWAISSTRRLDKDIKLQRARGRAAVVDGALSGHQAVYSQAVC